MIHLGVGHGVSIKPATNESGEEQRRNAGASPINMTKRFILREGSSRGSNSALALAS